MGCAERVGRRGLVLVAAAAGGNLILDENSLFFVAPAIIVSNFFHNLTRYSRSHSKKNWLAYWTHLNSDWIVRPESGNLHLPTIRRYCNSSSRRSDILGIYDI
jgi:hypothetical protein